MPEVKAGRHKAKGRGCAEAVYSLRVSRGSLSGMVAPRAKQGKSPRFVHQMYSAFTRSLHSQNQHHESVWSNFSTLSTPPTTSTTKYKKEN